MSKLYTLVRPPDPHTHKPNKTGGWDPCPFHPKGKIKFSLGRAVFVLDDEADIAKMDDAIARRLHPFGVWYDVATDGEDVAGPEVRDMERTVVAGADGRLPNETMVPMSRAQAIAGATPAMITQAVKDEKIGFETKTDAKGKERTYYNALDCERYRREKGG